jgi:hypothetical protein
MVITVSVIVSVVSEQKAFEENSKTEDTRVSAVFERATVVYWSKSRLDGLKVKYEAEIAEPRIDYWTREYLDTSYVRYQQGFIDIPARTAYLPKYRPTRRNRLKVETLVRSTRYVYSWVVPLTLYRNEINSEVNPDSEAVCDIIFQSGETEEYTFKAKYSVSERAFHISTYVSDGWSDRQEGIFDVHFKLKNLVSGRKYLLGSQEFIADDSGERDCSIDIPNYGLRSYLFNEDSSYRVLLHSMDDSGVLKEELAFDVSLGDIDWKR